MRSGALSVVSRKVARYPQRASAVGPAVERPLESALETVALGEFAEMLAIGRVVLVVEVAAARRGEPGGPAHQHAIGFFDHTGEVLDLLVVGLGLAVTQLIGRAPLR